MCITEGFVCPQRVCVLMDLCAQRVCVPEWLNVCRLKGLCGPGFCVAKGYVCMRVCMPWGWCDRGVMVMFPNGLSDCWVYALKAFTVCAQALTVPTTI